ncbi:MAG: hypothetical protein CMP62_05520 [Flavobacteriales bacterium]|nr:hypothetical protein [Flavobacteriales bacterium]
MSLEYIKIPTSSNVISLGNTGMRVKDPRLTYFKILESLKEFRKFNKDWKEKDQKEFVGYLSEFINFNEEAVLGSAKDVRLKVAFLSQLGLVDAKKVITHRGKELLELSNQNNDTQEFNIGYDSFLYIKQFLKFQEKEWTIFPLLSLIYCCLEFENNLPNDVFSFVWPISSSKEELISNIMKYKETKNYKEVISLSSERYVLDVKKNIKTFLQSHNTFDSSDAFNEMMYANLPHGRGPGFKPKVLTLYQDFKYYWSHKNRWPDEEKIRFINKKLKSRYRCLCASTADLYQTTLFSQTDFSKNADWNSLVNHFEQIDLISSKDESEFILNFHILFMYIKKYTICEEYRDLNMRQLDLTELFIVEHDTISLDILFNYFFDSVKDKLLDELPLPKKEYKAKLIANHLNLGDVYSFLNLDRQALMSKILACEPEAKRFTSLKDFGKQKKENRLKKLVAKVFSPQRIITLLELMSPRQDDQIREEIEKWYNKSYEASIPALFEYILTLSFYLIFEKSFKIGEALNAKLDANLLPKSHAPGGGADIEIKTKNKHYLIEATLSDNNNQKQMEAEPVPRHLAHYIKKNSIVDTVAIFVAPKLDPNNLVVLRNYIFSNWYNSKGDSIAESMNILPLTIHNIIYLLKKKPNFEELENRIDKVLKSAEKDGKIWYESVVNKEFS